MTALVGRLTHNYGALLGFLFGALGQGVFFGLGGYVMAMHLQLADAGPSRVPDFMRLYGSGQVPLWWEPFRSPVVTPRTR